MRIAFGPGLWIPQQLLPCGVSTPQLFVQQEEIVTDDNKAAKVYDAIYSKISPQALRHTYYAYLAEHLEAGIWAYQYLNLGWKLGSKVDLLLSEERVHRIHRLGQKVSAERHRLLGMVRFQLLQKDIYYAAIEPDHNVVELMAPLLSISLGNIVMLSLLVQYYL
ncbi:MAG: DUF4130 domain-containing protein [Syntrophomonadaceae bacterium]|nr:DUF4130 domain-containing protein [Fermentimonas sp.]MDD3890466.1 DUF4130 domain-containing protein [Syntrophomonadaceae bacterium]MDD4550510.1 DUF4130 domain-containing protein [Syntrophomonadaceae bacterium]